MKRSAIKKRSAKMVKAIQLDKLCRQIIHARDNSTCQWCNIPSGVGIGMDWAHVKSRRFYITRWLPENSLILCDNCHRFAHDNPHKFGSWFTLKFPEREQAIDLRFNSGLKICQPLLRDWLEELRLEVERLK